MAVCVERLETRRMLTGGPTDFEQLLLELVNRARADPAAEAARLGIDLNAGLAPGTISPAAKQPLAFNPILLDAAGLHSQDMLDRDYFSHTNPEGQSPSARAAALGYGAGVGENIGWSGSTLGIDPVEQVWRIHQSLFRSSGHRVNLLTGSYTEAGTAVRFGEFTSDGDTFIAGMVTEKFGSRTAGLLTGVAFVDDVEVDGLYSAGEGLGGVVVTATNGSGASFTTTTSASGGYALPLANGTYGVVFSRGRQGTASVAVTISGGRNEKRDWVATQAPSAAVPLVDFNGDRITDTLWRQSGTNAFMAFMYDAAGNLSGQRLLGMDPGYTVVGTGDFDGNGVTDLIWEESATGVQVGWLFNADGTLAGATGLVPAPWRLQSTGDFDGDGRTDLVWQHGAGGATAVWLMNGLSIAGSAGLNSDPAYELVETGADFDANGDGKSDLIWRAVASGAHTLFRMNGVGVSSTTPLGGGLTQEIAGTGDFDGDGAHDIVWRELGSGRRLLRYYADGTFTGTQAELPLGTEWSLAGTFDGDGDGRNDMLWRYDGPGASQGANILWLMEGATIRGQRSLGGDATWRLFARG